MRTRSSEAEVGAFLRLYVEAIERQPTFDIWHNSKNEAFLYDSGFTQRDIVLVIKALKVAHYSWGPEPDVDASRPLGEVWMFWSEYEGYELYVKLKLEGVGTDQVRAAVCMSCHEPDFEIDRPYWPKRGR